MPYNQVFWYLSCAFVSRFPKGLRGLGSPPETQVVLQVGYNSMTPPTPTLRKVSSRLAEDIVMINQYIESFERLSAQRSALPASWLFVVAGTRAPLATNTDGGDRAAGGRRRARGCRRRGGRGWRRRRARGCCCSGDGFVCPTY